MRAGKVKRAEVVRLEPAERTLGARVVAAGAGEQEID